MCGIAGLVGPGSRSLELPSRMAGSLAHRGPDGEGLWQDTDAPVAFVHRRLAIVDLSPAGAQPMASADGRWMLCYNGEIYNHLELRAALEREGVGGWRGHSDSETLVEAVARWGIDRATAASVGMFAIALYDRRERRLHLIRDRFGEKPLYVGRVGRDLVFASELKAIRQHPDFDLPIDRRALGDLLSRGAIGAPWSIWRGIQKIPPAHHLEVKLGETLPTFEAPFPLGEWRGAARMTAYWDYAEVVRAGVQNPFRDQAEADAELERVLRQSIAQQAMADVPVGAFLSGGIDSSLVTALYNDVRPGGVKTFTIGFAEKAYDESSHAAAVAHALGTDHRVEIITPDDAMAVIPSLSTIYDEPFSDSSQIPTYLVSRMARRNVTVALSGDAGDELFGGYNRYRIVPRVWRALQRVPAPLRQPAGMLLQSLPPTLWNRVLRMLPGQSDQPHLGTKVHKLAGLMRKARSLDDVVVAFLDEWQSGEPPLSEGGGLASPIVERERLGNLPDETRLMLMDATTYLPNDILCKVDRASMACSLETRAPFLDHRVADVAARIPVRFNIAGGEGKLSLRRLLYRHLPRDLFERPKAGFALPLGNWLRGPLRQWASDLLSPDRLAGQGLVDEARVTARWNAHLSGRSDSTQAIWAVLMLESWLDDQANGVKR
ncbi:asparagine synthase (glutamine-hydrolyzing) [Sphingomonas sp. ASV193]|uniref:asparagine synthase (glutamine-hydrolyzing) n=1 Tax=Sphingomonas sp. ASV193 TaxID=3144405 RepID=UPI0032E919CB